MSFWKSSQDVNQNDPSADPLFIGDWVKKAKFKPYPGNHVVGTWAQTFLVFSIDGIRGFVLALKFLIVSFAFLSAR